jgi:predicted AAA+ superfamily ATPase
MIFPRAIEPHVRKILWDYRKMAFVSGPRQVGKTTFAKRLLASVDGGSYFNWDVATDQKKLGKDPYFYESVDRDPKKPFLVVLDEIHKYRRWKSYLKGAFDRSGQELSFLVTGSGRLDLYSKGGDSLMGRYLGITMFPLTVGELTSSEGSFAGFMQALREPPSASTRARDAFAQLFELNGFPEPFARSERQFLNSWTAERTKLLVREDIRDATSLRQLSLIEMLTHLLPEKVGGPLSIASMREDLGVAFETVRDWVAILHQFYYSFPLLPYSTSLTRALRKASKVYLFDWSEVPEESLRLENMVALHLHKAAATWNARGEGHVAVRYLRDREKDEVDFVITERNRPICLVECKLSETSPHPALVSYQRKLKVPVVVQLVGRHGICRKLTTEAGILWVISADRWLRALP